MLYLGYCRSHKHPQYLIVKDDSSGKRKWHPAGVEREPLYQNQCQMDHPFSDESLDGLLNDVLKQEYHWRFHLEKTFSWKVSDETAIIALCSNDFTVYYQYDLY